MELAEYFKEVQANGKKMWSLYKTVQRSPRALTRLYLTITVGSVLIESLEIPSKEILRDVLVMVKAIQHPIKGLFLRYYMLKAMKDKFPDKGSKFEG